MAMWNPWRGCHKCSEGCKFCYIHKSDWKHGINTNLIVKTDHFTAPVDISKKGEPKIKSGQTVYLCFSSDFLLQDADNWRTECWQMIRERQDLHFLFLTKRIERFMDCIPADWGTGYDNVTVGCTVENQAMVDYKLSIFDGLPIKHKDIILQPLIEKVDIREHLQNIELLVVGGESDFNARPLNYDWVLDIREQCKSQNAHFQFRQCGTHFIKDGKEYTLNVRELCSQAKKADIDL
jgi:protein gp37